MKFIFPGWLYLKIIQDDAKVLLNPRSGSKSHNVDKVWSNWWCLIYGKYLSQVVLPTSSVLVFFLCRWCHFACYFGRFLAPFLLQNFDACSLLGNIYSGSLNSAQKYPKRKIFCTMQSSILVNSDPKKNPALCKFFKILFNFQHYSRLLRILEKAALCKIHTIQIRTKQGITV